jgi:uncharacterized glyoxalase superfamily protein PhnB
MLQNRSIPGATVIPVLVYEDVPEAVEWLCDAFNFSVRLRIGDHRVQLTIGEGAIVVTERRVTHTPEASDPVILRPPRRGELSHTLLIRVEDVDDHYQRARESGARILEPPKDHAYGERQYIAEDLEGHRWTFSQSIADVAPEEWGGESGSTLA